MNSDRIAAFLSGVLIVWILGLIFLPPESCGGELGDDAVQVD